MILGNLYQKSTKAS